MKVFFTTEEERILLKKFIGKKLKCIKIDSDSEYWTRAVLFADDFAIEIHVDMEDFDFCGFTEELPYVRVDDFGDDSSVHSWQEISVGEMVSDVVVVEDNVDLTVCRKESTLSEKIPATDAIVIKTEKFSYSFYRFHQTCFCLNFMKAESFDSSLYPVQTVISDWTEGSGDGDEADSDYYTATATCDRKFISLKDGGEIVR